jgi:ribulose-5-phosphate 4-epimerase/fuculose-1-phosphate aldolase
MSQRQNVAETSNFQDQMTDRQRLAAAYRIVDYLGWCETIYGHLTLRVPGAKDHFLINPWGLRYDEVTASNLLEIDHNGDKVAGPNYPINKPGFVIHSAIHEARSDVNCVIHIHTVAGMAVAAQKNGLLPISMPGTGFWGQVGYHDYEGPSMNLGERKRLVASLGIKNTMILRNHGILTCGKSVEEAFILMFRLQRACEVQIAAQSGGTELITPPDQVLAESVQLTKEFLENNDGLPAGKLEFDSYVRLMDKCDPSFRR